MYKAYLLLRGNHQAGPFSLDELVAQNLQAGDLIWVEGKSTCWLFPYEIEALQAYVANPFASAAPKASVEAPAAAFVQQPSPAAQPSDRVRPTEVAAANPQPETRYQRSVEEVETDYMNWTVTQKRKRKTLSPRVAGGVLLLAGSAIAAYFYLHQNEPPTVLAPASVQASLPSVPAGTDAQPEEPPQTASRTAPQVARAVERNPGTPAVRSARPLKNPGAQPSAPMTSQPSSSPSTPSEEVRMPKNEVPEVVDAPVVREPAQKPVKEKKKLRESLRELFSKKKPAEAAEEDNPPPATNRQANRRDGEPVSTASADLVEIQSNEPDNWMMGVKGLKLTLRNRNPVALKSASVTVIYYSNQNKVLDRKTLLFQNVAANGRQTLPAPDHQHADHVSFELGEVVGKEDRYARK